jgi:Flp pilus assembly protein TadB
MELVLLTLVGVCATVSLALLMRGTRRSAKEVHQDLVHGSELLSEQKAGDVATRLTIEGEHVILNDELAAHGLLTERTRQEYHQRNRLKFVFGVLVGAIAGLLLTESAVRTIGLSVCGGAVGWLLMKRALKAHQVRYFREIEYLLPIVMERLVMAVQAGHDILAAVSHILRVEREAREHRRLTSTTTRDPVTQLLHVVYGMTQAGCSFESALGYVAQRVESAPLRHAFIHLGVAHREGGELIKPLRELADATQLYFQETVEEEIAKMPIKATMPLVLTFTGLILFFVTAPITQVSQIAERAAPGSQRAIVERGSPR